MFAGVAVQANALQQCVMFVEKEHYPCQPIPCIIDGPRVGNAQFTGDVCNRISAGLSEPYRHAHKLLCRGLLDFLHDLCPPLSENFLNFHYSLNLGQPHYHYLVSKPFRRSDRCQTTNRYNGGSRTCAILFWNRCPEIPGNKHEQG